MKRQNLRDIRVFLGKKHFTCLRKIFTKKEFPSPSLGLRQYKEKGCPTKEGQTCVEIEGSTPGQFPIVSILSVIIENWATQEYCV